MSQATLVKWGNGQGVRLTKQVLDDAGLRVGDIVNIRVDENGDIVMSPAHRAKEIRVPNFGDLFAGYDGEATHEDGAANPVGREAL